MKRCPKCQKDGQAFHKNKARYDGLACYCLECERGRKRRGKEPGKLGDLDFDIDVIAPPPEPLRKVDPGVRVPTLIIPDTHFPFHSERGLDLLIQLCGDLKPKRIVQVGDLYDLLSYSKYPRSLNIMTPRDEVDEARLCAVSMWADLRRASPGAECIQLRGNHDDRANKRVVEALPAIEHLVRPAINALFEFDGVRTIQDGREELFVDDYAIIHGHLGFGQHAFAMGSNVWTGHLHIGGVVIKRGFWDACCGFLGDPNAPVFSYYARKRTHNTNQGVGWCDKYGPRFVSF